MEIRDVVNIVPIIPEVPLCERPTIQPAELTIETILPPPIANVFIVPMSPVPA